MVAQAPFVGPQPPDLPGMPDVSPALSSYLRNFALWAKNGLSGKLDVNSSAPAHLMQGHDAPPRSIPNVYKFQVSQAGVASLAPVALGSSPASTPLAVPIFPEAPMDGGSYVREDGGWAPAVPAAGGDFTGDITAPNVHVAGALTAGAATIAGALAAATASLTGLLSGVTATFSGAVTAGSLSAATATLTGLLSGVAATFTGRLTLGAGVTFTTLPPQAANDAAALAAGVPVGGTYCNGSIMMVRQV
jgi:hypothetical protein